MSFKDKVDELRNQAQTTQAANKIIDQLKKLENSNNEDTSYRWIWELIQNAKDVVNSTGKVDILVNFDEDRKIIEFKHNGKLFLTKNIVFLIEQVSTKERNELDRKTKKITGKFGTGFLTTHLLSKKVNVTGYLCDEDEPVHQFRIDIDRSSDDQTKIIKSIEDSCEQLNKNAVKVAKEINESDFNTCFTYELDVLGIKTAKAGLNNLVASIAYVFAFVPEIESITIQANTVKGNYKQVLSRGYDVDINLRNAKVITVCDTKRNNPRYIFALKDEALTNLSIAVELIDIGEKANIQKINENLPKLFCDFPLLGTSDFSFPVVVNNPYFEPTEPRDGIELESRAEEKQFIKDNKGALETAVKLYKTALSFFVENNYKGVYNIVKIKEQPHKTWLNAEWFDNKILEPIKVEIKYLNLITTNTGDKKPLFGVLDDPVVLVPKYQENREEMLKLWSLSNALFPEFLPKQDELEAWCSSLWDECKNLGIDNIVQVIQGSENISSLENKLSGQDVFVWLNEFYTLLLTNEDESCKRAIEQSEVFLNQNGKFCFFNKVFLDKEIDNVYKEVLSILDIDVKDKLLHKMVSREISNHIELRAYGYEELLSETTRCLQNEHENREHFFQRILCIQTNEKPKQDDFLNIAKKFYNNTAWETVGAKKCLKSIFKQALEYWVVKLCADIQKSKTLDVFSTEHFSDDKDSAITFINQLVLFLEKNDYIYLADKYSVLLNQNGVFKKSTELQLDTREIDEVVKDAYSFTGEDIRVKLLMSSIDFPLSENTATNLYPLANAITNYIENHKNKLGEDSDREKLVFQNFFSYLKRADNKQIKNAFKTLYSNLYWFYNDDIISDNMQKAEKYEQLLSRHSVKSFQELEELLKQATSNVQSAETINISREQLAEIGINTEEELLQVLNVLLGEGEITDSQLGELPSGFSIEEVSKKFLHSSKNNKYSRKYYEEIMNNAIEKVFYYLKETGKYVMSEKLEEWKNTYNSKTVFGAKKNGADIRIVVRPSDDDKIIFFYEQEVAAMDDTNYELWTSNNDGNTRMITLGDIIKTTGISVIPLKNLNPK
ncbi:sacsin N-terminal ATP-binding-like domain-containing protein [Paenibacillus sp. AGC30]